MAPDQIKPWIDLITWELLTLVGGVLFIPPLIIFLFRVQQAKIGGVEWQVSKREIAKIEKLAEEDSEEKSEKEAVEDVATFSEPDQVPTDVRDRLAKVIRAWTVVQNLVKARAQQVGGKVNRRATVNNLRLLQKRYPAAISSKLLERATSLYHRIDEYKSDPNSLTYDAFRSFAISAGKVAAAVETIAIAERQQAPEAIPTNVQEQ